MIVDACVVYIHYIVSRRWRSRLTGDSDHVMLYDLVIRWRKGLVIYTGRVVWCRHVGWLWKAELLVHIRGHWLRGIQL